MPAGPDVKGTTISSDGGGGEGDGVGKGGGISEGEGDGIGEGNGPGLSEGVGIGVTDIIGDGDDAGVFTGPTGAIDLCVGFAVGSIWVGTWVTPPCVPVACVIPCFCEGELDIKANTPTKLPKSRRVMSAIIDHLSFVLIPRFGVLLSPYVVLHGSGNGVRTFPPLA